MRRAISVLVIIAILCTMAISVSAEASDNSIQPRWSYLDAVVASGRSRLRPILMTTLTTVLGMIPMAVGNGVGAEMWNSLGMSVAWGLSFSTLVTLFLIPVLFTWLALRQQRKEAKKLAKLNA